jgi:hypothetical protein
VFITCTRGDNRQGRTISSCSECGQRLCLSHVQGEIIDKVMLCLDKHNIWPHCKTILFYLVDYLPLYMWQTQHLTTLQDDIVLPCRLSPLAHVTNTTSDHTTRRYCPTLSIISPCTCDNHNIWPQCKTIGQMLCLSHVQGEIIDKVEQYRLAVCHHRPLLANCCLLRASAFVLLRTIFQTH